MHENEFKGRENAHRCFRSVSLVISLGSEVMLLSLRSLLNSIGGWLQELKVISAGKQYRRGFEKENRTEFQDKLGGRLTRCSGHSLTSFWEVGIGDRAGQREKRQRYGNDHRIMNIEVSINGRSQEFEAEKLFDGIRKWTHRVATHISTRRAKCKNMSRNERIALK